LGYTEDPIVVRLISQIYQKLGRNKTADKRTGFLLIPANL